MDWTGYAIGWGLAFLSGSIPFAVLIGRAKGVDIRKVGSGNPGATNLGRAVGKKWGLLCFVLDLMKGLVPVLFVGLGTQNLIGVDFFIDNGTPTVMTFHEEADPMSAVFAGQWVGLSLAAVLGHMFSPWLGFRGGKGVATGLGGALGLFPYVTLPGVVCGVVWVIAAKLTGYVGLSSCLAAALLPVLTGLSAWWLGLAEASWGAWWVLVGFTALLAALVIVRHRGNLKRLLSGTEPKAAWTGKA